MKSILFWFSKKSSGSRGAAQLEFALTFPLFIMVALGGFETVRYLFINSTLQNAVHRVGRFTALDCPDPGVLSCDSNTIFAKLEELSRLNLPAAEFKLCPNAGSDCAANSRGDDGAWVYLRAAYPYRLLMGSFQVNLSAATLVKNETAFNTSRPVNGEEGEGGMGGEGGGGMGVRQGRAPTY